VAAKYPQYSVHTDGYQLNRAATVISSTRTVDDPNASVRLLFRFVDLPGKPRACFSSAKLVGEGFEYKYKTLDEVYDDVVEYGKNLGILPY
jgi:anthocyanidin reductase